MVQEEEKKTWESHSQVIRTNKKKILFVITKSVWGGAQKYVYDLAVNLSKDKFEIAVAAGEQGKLAEEIKKAGVAYYEIKNFKRDVSFISDILAFFEISKILYKFKPHIVHVNSSKAGGITGFAVKFYLIYTQGKGVKNIFTAHGWAFNEARPKWQIFLIKLASRITCVFYDKIICVSEFDRQAAIKNKIASEKKLIMIHNGINIDEGVFLDKEKAREKIFNFQTPIFNEFSNSNFQNSNNIIIGTVGEFTKNKGQQYFIDLFESLGKSGFPSDSLGKPDFPSGVIIGWGEDKQKLEKKIKELGLKDKVFLIEGVLPAAPYLKAFDIFVLPSLKEGLPYTLFEAGLAGLPVIATNVGGIPEIIENEKTGLLVGPADSNEIASAIQKLLEDKNLREKLADSLRQKIISEFSLEKMVKETLRIYL